MYLSLLVQTIFDVSNLFLLTTILFQRVEACYDLHLEQTSAGVVKTTNNVVLQPLESKLRAGFARKTRDVESVVTELAETGTPSRVIICPRVVGLNKPGTSARVPVWIYNISAKAVTIPAKSPICELEEVDV